MSFEVVESSVVGKAGDDALCEDLIVMTAGFAGVIDGATDVTGRRFAGITGGRFAALALQEAVRRLDPDVDAIGAVQALSSALADAVGEVRGDGPSAAITLVSAARREVWQIGDVAWWWLDHEPLVMPEPKAIDVVAGDIRAAVLNAYLRSGVELADLARRVPDPGREAVEPLLRAQRVLRNSTGPWAYGAIDGDRVPPELVAVSGLGGGSCELVVASDGYPRPARSLAGAEAELARLLRQDPLCIGPLRGAKGRLPGHGSFDDRAFLRLRLAADGNGRPSAAPM